MTVPFHLPYYVLAGSAGFLAAGLIGLDRALRNDHWAMSERAATVRAASAILLSWFLLSVWLALAGFYSAGPGQIPTIQYGIFVPILIGGVLIWRLPRFARAVDAIPASSHGPPGWAMYLSAFLPLSLRSPIPAIRKQTAIWFWPGTGLA